MRLFPNINKELNNLEGWMIKLQIKAALEWRRPKSGSLLNGWKLA